MSEFNLVGDRESLKYQTDEWVAGRPWHNIVRDECCPDFSCCLPKNLAPLEVRTKFAEADEHTQMGMLGMFLSGAIASEFPEKEVYVAGITEGSA